MELRRGHHASRSAGRQLAERRTITVHTLGKEQIDVRGNAVAADHFRIDTERNRIELWYSPEGEWIGLRSTTRNGHVLEYRLR